MFRLYLRYVVLLLLLIILIITILFVNDPLQLLVSEQRIIRCHTDKVIFLIYNFFLNFDRPFYKILISFGEKFNLAGNLQ